MNAVSPILSIRNLSISINDEARCRHVVKNLNLDVAKGETVALVGESGSGKTLTALSVLRLLPEAARITTGAIHFGKTDLLRMNEKAMRDLRGDRVAMIFQEPTTSLNPLMIVGEQIAEAIRLHQGLDRNTAKEQVLALMELVGIPDPLRRYRSYPHQLSGGIRQRVVIAIALACRPELLLADEPTSALDTTVQAQIVDLLSRLISDLGMSVLLITHDLGVVAALSNRVAVLYDGVVLEEGQTSDILKSPLHPYTRALLSARPLSDGSMTRQLSSETITRRPVDDTELCPFLPKCNLALERCSVEFPDNHETLNRRWVRCHLRARPHD